jgi:leucyl/phenylalanyl-tRNA--protein transferase
MFTQASNASKAAFINLIQILQRLKFVMIDCQIYTDHLKSLGSEMISRERYIDVLQAALQQKTWQGSWRAWEKWLPDVIDSDGRNL